MSKTWVQFLIEKNGVSYDFSSTQVNIPTRLANKVLRWGADNIPEEALHKVGDKFGREDEIHATILYGVHDEEPDAVKQLLTDVGPLKLELGKISLFANNSKFDVVKISVISPDLHKLHTKFKENLEYSSDYPRYQPHVTIAYVKKGKGDKYDGNEDFLGERAEIDTVIFSSKNGTKTKIKLARTPAKVEAFGKE